jgi:ribosome assembly protein YihI (activator of Der GTPase)
MESLVNQSDQSGETTHLEDGLHLRELWERMLGGEHLDNEASDTPDVCFTRIDYLLDDFRRHPENRALQ